MDIATIVGLLRLLALFSWPFRRTPGLRRYGLLDRCGGLHRGSYGGVLPANFLVPWALWEGFSRKSMTPSSSLPKSWSSPTSLERMG